MQLKLDENLDVGLAVWLESLGHDAKTVREEQMSGASDDHVFAAAAAEDRCLVTLDLDFSDPIHFSTSNRNNRPTRSCAVDGNDSETIATSDRTDRG
jgi:predicted nuclease of predicted toxin-antitoxin system